MILLKTKHLKEIQNDIILSMANIVENRDLNTGGHIKRTSDCIKIFVPEIKKVDYIAMMMNFIIM